MVGAEGARVGGPTPDEAGFRAWAALRMPQLRRRAFILCGDSHAADDLVQDTLERVFVRWARIAQGNQVDSYTSRVMITRHIDNGRRPWRREVVTDQVPETADNAAGRAFAHVDGRDADLARALATLPATQRTVLVLRYVDDLTVEEVARLLDLPVGTVKSRLHRGSEAVRNDLLRLRRGTPVPATPRSRPDLENDNEH